MEERLQMLLLLGIIIIVSKLAATLSNHIGQPAVFGELLVGLILGPTVVNLLGWHVFDAEALGVVVRNLAELGVIILMFLAGLETDLDEMKRVGVAALSGATGGIILPFGFGLLVSRLFGLPWRESIFVGTILTATSVSISAQTLMELGQLRSREGMTILGAAVIDDVMGIIVLSLVIAFSRPGESGALGIGVLLLKMVLYFALALFLGFRFLERLTRGVERLFKASEAVLAFALAFMFAYAWAAEAIGQVAAITGAYIAGILFTRTSYGHHLAERMRIIGYGFLVPVFFVSIGLQANARTLGASLGFTAAIVGVAVLTKAVGAGLGTLLTRFTVKESVRVGIGMISRGEVALIVATIGLNSGIIDRDIFSIMVIMTLVTTLVTPVLLRGLFPRQPATSGGAGGPAPSGPGPGGGGGGGGEGVTGDGRVRVGEFSDDDVS